MKQQDGNSLVIVVIALMLLLILSIAYIRSSNIASLVAENYSFKTAASQAGDIGIQKALLTLQAINNPDSNIANQYYALAQSVDNNGLPTTVNWAQVPVNNYQLYQVQYVLERMCSGNLPVANALQQCLMANSPANGSDKVGTPNYRSTAQILYRATIRVTGPKNTLSFIQAMLAK